MNDEKKVKSMTFFGENVVTGQRVASGDQLNMTALYAMVSTLWDSVPEANIGGERMNSEDAFEKFLNLAKQSNAKVGIENSPQTKYPAQSVDVKG